MRAKQSPNESAQSRCIEQNAFKTFRRRRHEIDVVVVASAKAQTCAHLRTQTRNRRCCCCFCKSSDVCAFAHAWQSLSYSVMVLIIICYSDSVPWVNLQIRHATKKRAKISCRYHKLHEAAWADPEGGRGSGPPLKNHKNIGFLSNAGPDSLKNLKSIKPAFNFVHSSARQWNGITWRFAGGPMMARW